MRRLIPCLTLLAGVMIAGSAHALPYGMGSYCSAATTDGYWSFAFGYDEPTTACSTVEQALYLRTPAAIMDSHSGYFQTNGWNSVFANCLGSTNTFSGYGSTPLQNASDWANLIGGVQCLFTVN